MVIMHSESFLKDLEVWIPGCEAMDHLIQAYRDPESSFAKHIIAIVQRGIRLHSGEHR